MRICLGCQGPLGDSRWGCAACGWAPLVAADVHCFGPDIMGSGNGYDATWFAELMALEEGNYWFEARNRQLLWMAERILIRDANYLEIGCGTGFVLRGLNEAFPAWRFSATEAQVEGIAFARSRLGADVDFMQMDARHIPFRDEFDVIGAFDVIEHIDDDLRVLREIYAALRLGGYVLLSVPQHPLLWSEFDEQSYHCRRYGRRDLDRLLQSEGFAIVDSRAINSLLLPMMAASRIVQRRRSVDPADVLDELRVSPWVNSALARILRVEYALNRSGLRLPLGGSRMVLARKVAAA